MMMIMISLASSLSMRASIRMTRMIKTLLMTITYTDLDDGDNDDYDNDGDDQTKIT